MKRRRLILLLLVAAGILCLLYYFRQQLGIFRGPSSVAKASWRMVNRPEDGFQLEMPGEPQETQVPTQNESGGVETVKMLLATPSSEITYSISWADNPPVMRAGGGAPERILSLARDQALTKTQTTAISESPTTHNGLPARELMAQNAGGGIFQTRLVYAGSRLYMLTAAYPSLDARREQDVIRFFNSFKPDGTVSAPQPIPADNPSNIPQALPLAAAPKRSSR